MAHRYLYYIKNSPVISDYEYDILEHAALQVVDEDHPLHFPGSDMESSYSKEIIELANKL